MILNRAKVNDMNTLVKNGKIYTAGDNYSGDIYIEDGIISDIGTDIRRDADNYIDAKGMVVIPGGIDVHTHFNLHAGDFTANDDFYTGTIAAACGGTTSIVDHMGFGPRGCSLMHQVEQYHKYADGNAVIDYGFHGVVQHVDDEILDEMNYVISTQGIPSFKIYLTYDYRIRDADAFKVMKRLKELGGITAVHSENDSMINLLRVQFIRERRTAPIDHAKSRPEECEEEAVCRMIDIARLAGDAPLYIVHLSTEGGLNHIIRARSKGSKVYAETCPQYLLLDEEKYNEPDCGGLKYIMSPPLRKKTNTESLWKGLHDGYIQVVATDHCPFSFNKDKQAGRDDFTKCPNGAPGVEERIPLLFSEGVMKGKIGINRFVEVCCTNPAKLFGMYPKKGTIAPGSDGDIVIIDPEREVTLTQNMLHSNADYTAYEGFRLKGYPVLTISRGEIVAKDGEFTGQKGRGKYIKRNSNKGGGMVNAKGL